jgi:hypothetical protein
MMKRNLVWAAAGLLALTTSIGGVLAQNGVPVNADGSYVVADDDAPTNIVSGQGEDITYGNIDTGGGGGDVYGDPSAVFSPNVPTPGGGVPIISGSGDGMIGGMPIVTTAPAAPDATTMTTTSLATTEGTATENVPVETMAPAETAPAASDTGAAAAGFCAQYASWYDAQVAYENLGATAADPALVQEVDPNYDGIACEEYMA